MHDFSRWPSADKVATPMLPNATSMVIGLELGYLLQHNLISNSTTNPFRSTAEALPGHYH